MVSRGVAPALAERRLEHKESAAMARGSNRFGRSPIKAPSVSWRLLLLLGFGLCFGLMGALEYQDEAQEANFYCSMVYQKLWVDYRRTYEQECEAGRFVGARR